MADWNSTTIAGQKVETLANQTLNDLQQEASFLVPTSGRLIVVRDGFRYTGKIIIPDKAHQLPTTGRVVAVGNEDHDFLLGKRVVWGRYSGLPIQFSGRPAYDCLTYEEIIAFVNDDNVKLELEDHSSMNRE